MNNLFFNDLELIKNDERQFSAYKSMHNTAVIAGPGSGKTRVLTLKAISLAKSHINKPSGIACISFSREAVRELKKRLASYGYMPSSKDFIGTVHSFSLLHVLEPFAHLYPQYGIQYPIKILPDEIREQIYNNVLKELNITNPWDLQLNDINKYRSLSLIGRSYVPIDIDERLDNASKIFEKHLYQTAYLDFISIINLSAKIIHDQVFVRQVLQSKFPWLLVDEYQDLGKALHEIVLELVFHAGIKLYAVGDVNQSIYGFNGGYPDFLQELIGFDDISAIYLAANYRSSQHIIDASLAALQPTPPPPDYTAKIRKNDLADFTFITCNEEMYQQYEIVATKIIPKLLYRGIPLNEIGVIISSNSETRQMANFLQVENIPFFIAKWQFENSAIVVWLQECALWCLNSVKESFSNLFKFWTRILKIHNDNRRSWETIQLKTIFFDILNISKAKKNVYEWLNFVVDQLDLNKTLFDSKVYPNEIKNIERLIEEAKLYNLKGADIKRFANLGTPDNEVTITTRHSCKGLEFEAVILLGMEEGRFPNYRHFRNSIALAEDQRLCYVCISRAKGICILLRSEIFTLETRNGPWRKSYPPSRYWISLHDRFGTDENSFARLDYK